MGGVLAFPGAFAVQVRVQLLFSPIQCTARFRMLFLPALF